MFFKRKDKVEVVPESKWTNFGNNHATRKDLAIAACIPGAVVLGMVSWRNIKKVTSITAQSPVEVASYVDSVGGVTRSELPTIPEGTPDSFTAVPTGAVTDHLAGASLDVFATIMNPILDLLVALSLPVASIMMVGALFMIMVGMKEKAYTMLMHTGLGYVLIQMSPLLLSILKNAGNAVQPQ